MKKLLALLFVVGFAPGALAEVKVYNSTPPGGTPGDRVGVRSTLCPTTAVSPGDLQGSAVIDDDGSGTVTLDQLQVLQPSLIDIDTTLVFGPGSFIFIDADTTDQPAPGQTGLGSTAKGTGSVTWGVLGGWTATGFTFCLSSPPSTCDGNVGPSGTTVSPMVTSPTYDLGTWTFDAEGDYEGTPYIERTSNGNLANTQWELRGSFVGAGIPALPLVGVGVVALGLLAVGARSLVRKK